MKTFYKKSIFMLYALLVFFIPLIFTPFTIETFEFPKTTFFYIVSCLILMLYLVEVILEDKKIYKNLLLVFRKYWIILLLILSYLISSIFSFSFYTSLWGYYGRFNGGLISIILLISLLFISYEKLKNDDFINLFFLNLFSMTLVSLYGIYQYYFELRGTLEPRIYSTFGHPNWLSQYLSMLLPLVIYLFSNTLNKFTKYFNIYLLITYILLFWSFWLTFSFSGILAILGACVFLYKFKATMDLNKLSYLAIISLFIVVTNFSFFRSRVNDFFIDTKKFITQQFTVFAEDSYTISDSGFIRQEIWKGTLNLFISNYKIFFVGVGPQNFAYEFQKYRPQTMNYSSEWEYVVNRPHNYYLEILVELGVIGFIFYIWLIYTVFIKSPYYLKPSLIAFYISNFFGWPVMISSLFFWIVVSYIIKQNEITK